VAHHCVLSRNLVNEEALGHLGAFAPKTNKSPSMTSLVGVLLHKFRSQPRDWVCDRLFVVLMCCCR